MKKIEAVITPSQMEEVKSALAKIGIRRMSISRIDEFESQKGHKELYRGEEYIVNVVKEFKIELTVADEMLDPVIEAIGKSIKMETIGEGEVSVSPAETVIRFRRGEREQQDVP